MSFEDYYIKKQIDKYWNTEKLFYRPDPLGYCYVMQSVYKAWVRSRRFI